MSVIDSNELTKLLKLTDANLGVYTALKLPANQVLIQDTSYEENTTVEEAILEKPNKVTTVNPLLTPVSNICTWEITHDLGVDITYTIREISTNNLVAADVTCTSTQVIVTINSTENIASGTYKITIIG